MRLGETATRSLRASSRAACTRVTATTTLPAAASCTWSGVALPLWATRCWAGASCGPCPASRSPPRRGACRERTKPASGGTTTGPRPRTRRRTTPRRTPRATSGANARPARSRAGARRAAGRADSTAPSETERSSPGCTTFRRWGCSPFGSGGTDSMRVPSKTWTEWAVTWLREWPGIPRWRRAGEGWVQLCRCTSCNGIWTSPTCAMGCSLDWSPSQRGATWPRR
mmetsp:Transcript_52606/g.163351  ORF Transcript_52606/g.163351 Transcript_52606/m.163351 type:complete len:226 (+) Transcript_52606:482-1159(+)